MVSYVLSTALNMIKCSLFPMVEKKIGQGAEASVFLDRDIIKRRFEKSYRIPEIDNPLRKFRTRRESKILSTLAAALW